MQTFNGGSTLTNRVKSQTGWGEAEEEEEDDEVCSGNVTTAWMVPCDLGLQKLRSWCGTREMPEGLEAD